VLDMKTRVMSLVTPRGRRRPGQGVALALSPLLQVESEACQAYRAAVNSGNRRWIAAAHRRWLEAHEMTLKVLDDAAA
jgi:hypothetical protein